MQRCSSCYDRREDVRERDVDVVDTAVRISVPLCDDCTNGTWG